jgi:hypothetical protein
VSSEKERKRRKGEEEGEWSCVSERKRGEERDDKKEKKKDSVEDSE